MRLNLGIIYHKTGHYSLSGPSFRQAWDIARQGHEPRAKALADRALGELAISEAYLGRQHELAQLLNEAHRRNLSGAATELIACAAEGLQNMRLHPERSFMCGPNALGYICRVTGHFTPQAERILGDSRCQSRGTSLAEVQKLSERVGLGYQMAYRTRGSSVITPAVVHWKVGHFASLTPGRSGRYHVQDATDGTFGSKVLISPTTLDEEASGYFLVPSGPLPAGWRSVPTPEGKTVWGKGDPGSLKVAGGNTRHDQKVKDKDDCPLGMTVWDVHAMEVSLSLTDSPVGLSGAAFAVPFTMNYSQREVAQPANFNYTNFGPKWTCNWIGIITDDIADSGRCSLFERGGGLEHFLFDNGQSVSKVERFSLSTLTKVTGDEGTSFLRTFPDGSSEVYGLASGNKYFLTEVRDSHGNTTRIQFDAQLRIQTITDPVGRVMQLSYENQDPLKVTKVVDFAGRSADFTYTDDGHLASIRDVLGMISSYHYGNADFIDQLTTPYGSTQFTYGDSSTNPGDSIGRFLEITDPAGRRSRVEYTHSAPIAFSDSQAPQGLTLWNAYLYSRNTFYWEPQQLGSGTPDYAKATVFHFTHSLDDVAELGSYATGRTLESMKKPLQTRIWYDHPPGYNPYGVPTITFDGTLNVITAAARLLSDGSTQIVRYAYNSKGNMTQRIDPMGRVFQYDYAPNEIDLVSVSTGSQTLLAASYDGNHNIVSLTDASGGTHSFSYDARGLMTSHTNALGETTTYDYTPSGNLAGIHEPMQKNTTFAYDSAERLVAATDSEGHTVEVAYDDFERPVSITYPDGTSEHLTYSRLDLAETSDRLGRTTHIDRDSLGRMLSLTDSNGGVTSLDYGLEDGPSSLTDRKGNTTSFQYDLQQRLVAKLYPGGASQAVTYEQCAGRVHSVTDALGHSKTMSYFLDNTLKSIVYSGNTPSVQFTNDSFLPRPLSMTDGTGTTSYTYGTVGAPGANRLTEITGPYGDAASFQYDVAGRVTSQTVNGSVESVTYDALWRPTETTNELDTFTLSYLGATNQVTGISSTLGPSATYAYADNVGDRRLTQIKNLGRSGTALSQFDYVYDPAGQITKLTETLGGATDSGGDGDTHHHGQGGDKGHGHQPGNPGYENGNGHSKPHGKNSFFLFFAPDEFGPQAPGLILLSCWGVLLVYGLTRPADRRQRVRRAACFGLIGSLALNGCLYTSGSAGTVNVYDFSYDRLGQLVGVALNQTPTEQYTFDASGNLETLTVSGTTTNFSYNSLNQPTEQSFDAKGQTTSNGDTSFEWDDQGRVTAIVQGTQRSEFAYDGLSRRTKITEYTDGAVTSKKLYWWLGGSIVCERDGLQTGFPITKRYFSQGLVQGTTKLFYTFDHLGSVRELVDSNGTVQAQYRYATYGQRSKESGNLDSDWGYAGLWHHGPSGLDLATYRVYDSNRGRWISRDPLGEGVDYNLYRYCGNSPANFMDQLGLWEIPFPSPGAGAAADVIGLGEGLSAIGAGIVEGLETAGPYGAIAGGGGVITKFWKDALEAEEQAAVAEGALITTQTLLMAKKKTKRSDKEKKNDCPNWIKDLKGSKKPDESIPDFLKRLLDEKYGIGKWKKGAGSEFSQAKKWLEQLLK